MPDSVVLWTRLMAEDPARRPGGAPTVDWTVAEDERLEKVVRSGQATAEPAWAHSVHVDVGGLRPNRPYWYRFVVNGKASPVGRTRTAPAATEPVAALRFAYASCQQYEQGYYSALRHMSGDDLNAVLFLGDYIYEYDPKSTFADRLHTQTEAFAAGAGNDQLNTIGDYRARYGLYNSDPSIQAARANVPWICMWSDHEVENNYASFIDDVRLVMPAPAAPMRARSAGLSRKSATRHEAPQESDAMMPMADMAFEEGSGAAVLGGVAFGGGAQPANGINGIHRQGHAIATLQQAR